MHTFDGISDRLTFSLVLLLALWSIPACDGNTIVSSSLSPDDVVVNADTIFINNTSLVKSPSFSGNRTFFTSGVYEDPIFGTLTAASLVRPSISFVAEADTIGPDAVARLSLSISNIYGSTTEPVDFNIVEIDRPWRSRAWRYDSIPELSDRIVGQFTVTGPDSIAVLLSDEWTQRYRDVFHQSVGSQRDSLYRIEMPGLAIVPAEESSGKIFSVQGSSARLIIESGGELPELNKGMSSWAVSLSTSGFNEEAAGTSMPVLNTLGSMIELDMELSEEFLGTNNFSRVELVLYEDTVRMNSGSDIDPDFVRPRSETLQIFYLEPDLINYAISVDPRFQGNRRTEDSSYRINLTNIAHERMRNPSDPRRLYAVIGSNDGRVLPMLLSGPEDTGARQPKILITSISQE